MAIEVVAAPSRSRRIPPTKLSPSLPRDTSELAELLDLKGAARSVRAGHELISEGKRCTSLFLISDGVAIRYRILRDGQRQILNFLLPGDFAGITACRFAHALYSVRTLTPATIAPVPVARLLALFETHTQLAARFFWSFTAERAIISEHLIAIGRRSAPERIAHLLLELHNRLQVIGLANERSYRLPLTQEMISDALGLSIPYVNRVLQQLRQDGLVTFKDRQVIIENMDELRAFADFEQAYLQPLSFGEFIAESE